MRKIICYLLLLTIFVSNVTLFSETSLADIPNTIFDLKPMCDLEPMPK